jgi:hypothetical protein
MRQAPNKTRASSRQRNSRPNARQFPQSAAGQQFGTILYCGKHVDNEIQTIEGGMMPKQQPNVIVIMADQQKATASHLWGNSFCETPAFASRRIDGLARDQDWNGKKGVTGSTGRTNQSISFSVESGPRHQAKGSPACNP